MRGSSNKSLTMSPQRPALEAMPCGAGGLPLARHREPARRNPGEIGSDQHLSPAAAPEGRIRDRAASVILNVDRLLVDDYGK